MIINDNNYKNNNNNNNRIMIIVMIIIIIVKIIKTNINLCNLEQIHTSLIKFSTNKNNTSVTKCI